MRAQYLKGGMGYGIAKQQLFEKYWEYFRPMRKKREEIENDPGLVEAILKKGANNARLIAEKTLAEVKLAVGL